MRRRGKGDQPPLADPPLSANLAIVGGGGGEREGRSTLSSQKTQKNPLWGGGCTEERERERKREGKREKVGEREEEDRRFAIADVTVIGGDEGAGEEAITGHLPSPSLRGANPRAREVPLRRHRIPHGRLGGACCGRLVGAAAGGDFAGRVRGPRPCAS